MLKINTSYLESTKQELVDKVAKSKMIIPELIQLTVDLPAPKVPVKHITAKKDLKLYRRHNYTQMEIDYPYDYYSKLRDYQEKELLDFLEAFPEYKNILL